MVPQNYINLSGEGDLKNMAKLIDMLEDNDDVQNVWHNWDNDWSMLKPEERREPFLFFALKNHQKNSFVYKAKRGRNRPYSRLS